MTLEYTTGGESHGKGMIAMVKGLPSNIPVDLDFINGELARRQSGYGRGGRQKIETDKADILTGVRDGRTIGSPVTLAVWNADYANWKDTKSEPVMTPRPAHADLAGVYKYGLTDDIRHVLERSSARETAARVAGGALVRLFLREMGIEIFSHVINWAGIPIDTRGMSSAEIREKSMQSEISSACDEDTLKKVKARVDLARREGDTLGGIIETIISPMPPLIGSYQTYERKLDSRIARAVLSVQAVKGVEFGLGFGYAGKSGREAHDEIFFDKALGGIIRQTNRAGGIEGGMSNGLPIVFHSVMKPIPTLMTPLRTFHLHDKTPIEAIKERSDFAAVAACGVVITNAVSFEIADAFMERYGGDDIIQIKHNFETDPALADWQSWKRLDLPLY